CRRRRRRGGGRRRARTAPGRSGSSGRGRRPVHQVRSWCLSYPAGPVGCPPRGHGYARPTPGRRAMPFAPIEDAVAAIGRGEIVVVVDDEDRENEGDLIMAAEYATPEAIAFFLHHTSGYICAPVTEKRARELELDLMVRENTESMR